MLLISSICAFFILYLMHDHRENLKLYVASKTEGVRAIAKTIEQANASRYQKRIQSFVDIEQFPMREELIYSFSIGDREELLRQSKVYMELFKKENPYFSTIAWVSPDNIIFLRVHKPQLHGDNVIKMRPDIAAANEKQKPVSGYAVGVFGMEYRVVQPVFYKGEYAGIVQFGLREDYLLDAIHKQIDVPVVLVIPSERAAFSKHSDLPTLISGEHTVQSKQIELFQGNFNRINWGIDQQQISIKDKPYLLVKALDLQNYKGVPEGYLFVALDISAQRAMIQRSITAILLISAVMLLIAFFIIYISYGSLLGEITSLNLSLKKTNIDLEKRVQERTAKLQESQEHLESILAKSPLGIIIANAHDMVLEYANPAFCNILGFEQEELHDKSLTSLHRPEDAERVVKDFKRHITGEKTSSEDVVFLCENGNTVALDIFTTTLHSNGELSLAAFMIDRSEQKKMEAQLQQAQKMEAIGTLAGGIAHDFNNLLGAVLGYTDMARDKVQDDSALRTDLDKVSLAGNRAKELVAQILAFSRQTASEQKTLQPRPIIKEAIKLLRSSIPSTISIVQKIDNTCGSVKADPIQLHQIIMNLCTNAYQAMEEHGGTLTVTLARAKLTEKDFINEPSLTPGPFVRLTVEDTGPGIDPGIQKSIFDPYFTTKEVGRGTGMGLAVVHGIVKNHGGMIRLKSTPGKGASFSIYLPELQNGSEKETAPDVPVPGGDERILFVDDEKLLADMGRQLLERLGYRAIAVTSSQEAFELIKSATEKFDLVITDQTMPDMTGSDLAKAIFTLYPEMPVILCTGYSSTMSREKALAMGIKEYVLKPIVNKDIAQIIRRILDTQKVKTGEK